MLGMGAAGRRALEEEKKSSERGSEVRGFTYQPSSSSKFRRRSFLNKLFYNEAAAARIMTHNRRTYLGRTCLGHSGRMQ